MSISITQKPRFAVTFLLLLFFAFAPSQVHCGCGSSKLGAKKDSTAVQGHHNTVTNITYVIHNHYAPGQSPRELAATKRHIQRIRRRRSSSRIIPLSADAWSDQTKQPKPKSKPGTPLTVSNCDSSGFDDVETFELQLPGTPDSSH